MQWILQWLFQKSKQLMICILNLYEGHAMVPKGLLIEKYAYVTH